MAASRTTQFRQHPETLTAHGVEFLVVGGVAAILEGVLIVTQDLDVLVETTPGNLERPRSRDKQRNTRLYELSVMNEHIVGKVPDRKEASIL